MLSHVLPRPGPNTRIAVCGPQGMLDNVGPILLQLGYPQSSIAELRASTEQKVCTDQTKDTEAPPRTMSVPQSEQIQVMTPLRPPGRAESAPGQTQGVSLSQQQDAPIVGRTTMGSFADRVKAMTSNNT